MWLRKLKTIAAAMLAVAVVAGAGGLAYHGLAVEPPTKDRKQTDKPKRDREAILGRWQVVKIEVDGKDASETDDGKTFRSAPWTITKNKRRLIWTMAGTRSSLASTPWTATR